MKNIRVILISGLSGSGKTTAIKALEDIGFYCVDNLPILLLPKFIELCEQSGGKISKVAVVEDIRGEASYPDSTRITDPAAGGTDSGQTSGPVDSGQTRSPGEEKDFFRDSRRIIQNLKKRGISD